MTTERQKKIIYKANTREYLQKLNCFTLRLVGEADLLSVEETILLRAQAKQHISEEVYEFTIPFEEKASDRFQNYVSRLKRVNSSNIYIWIDRTIDCGTIEIESLADFKWDFACDCDPDGAVALATTDLQDMIQLDFFEVDGQQWLEVETSGPNWSKVTW